MLGNWEIFDRNSCISMIVSTEAAMANTLDILGVH